MTGVELPMFPLGNVLLPGQLLPLHVFEPRYRRLVEVCAAAEPPEFGVVLIDRGSEVGGGDERSDVGTVARILAMQRTPDGRYAVVAAGDRRLRVAAWLADDPHPRALVEEWPEELASGDAEQVLDRVAELAPRVRRALALAVELGDLSADPTADISDDPVRATHHLAGLAPLGPADRQALLRAEGPMARLDLLTDLLDDVEAVLAFRLGQPGE